MKTLYTTTFINNGGRDGGKSSTPDGTVSFAIAPPAELSGKKTSANNPEQLFAAGYSACFNSALQVALQQEGKKARPSQVTAKVELRQDESGDFFIAAELTAAVEGCTQAENQQLADLAHTICPYSKAIKGNVDVVVKGAEPA